MSKEIEIKEFDCFFILDVHKNLHAIDFNSNRYFSHLMARYVTYVQRDRIFLYSSDTAVQC